MTDKTKGSVLTDEELAEELSRVGPNDPTDWLLRLHGVSKVYQSELLSLLENARLGLEERWVHLAPPAALIWRSGLGYRAQLPMFACAAMPQEAAEGEPNAVSQLEVARNILEEAAARVSEDLKLAEQVRAQLEEVDEIIQRLGRDREEIDRLKEETRSNISELQRMVAA